ncbi:MAG: DEAD/DEAH box helicase [Nitrospinota bacterium]|nr:DEAD/DEAH box helicase [Nitrospinota bacterium]
MKLCVESNEVRIECSGMELLKLKTALNNRLGGMLKAEKSALVFPLSSLSLVQDLIEGGEKSPEIAETLRMYELHAEARRCALRIVASETVENVSEEWLQRLDPAQSYAVSAMTVPNLLGLCLFDEQGSGKTVMTIAAFNALKDANVVDAMIVVCPKTMMSEWPKDIEKFLPGKYEVAVAEGDRREKFLTALKDFAVLVTNYEGVESMQVALTATASQRRYLLVVDESYYVKNTESLRSDAAKRLRANCARCYVLCGTPAPNSPYDLVNQFNLADKGFTFAGFKKSKDLDGDRDKISDLIDTRGTLIRRMKTEILEDIPDKNFHIVGIPLTGRQAFLYEKARSELELELKALDNISFRRKLATYFQRRAVLLQICSNPSAIDPTITDVPVKYEYLDALMANLISKGRKVILWSFYKNSLDDLAARYAEYNPVRIDGSVDVATRRVAVRLFQENPERMVFIGNPAAAGAGVTLHAAYDAVYVSYSNQAAHYLQSLDRIHRRGQTAKEVNYYLLVCQDTIEETEVVRLRGKELQQHSILGDHISWPASLDEALKELCGHD